MTDIVTVDTLSDSVVVDVNEAAPWLVDIVINPDPMVIDVFAGPKGDKGDKGDTGAPGPEGPAGPPGEADNLRVLKAGDTMTGPLVNNYSGPSPTLMIEGHFNQTLGTDTSWSMFGDPVIISAVDGAFTNAIVGSVYNNAAPGSAGFPGGVNGYGKLGPAAQGNTVFGMFALAELYAAGGGMAIGHEITARNYVGTPDTALPPHLSFGTTYNVANGLQITAGGDYDTSIGVWVGQEGGSTRQFNTASYLWAFRQYGLYIEAQASGSQNNIVSKSNGNAANLTLQTTGTAVPNNPVMYVLDAGGAGKFAVTQGGQVIAADAITSQFGGIATQGSNASFNFAERDNPSNSYIWYASGTAARLTRTGGGDLFVVGSNGVVNTVALTAGSPTAPGGGIISGDVNAQRLMVNGVPALTASGISGMVLGQIPIAASATTITSSTASLAASFMPAHTGDVTSPAGSTVNTLATVNANVGTWNNITINAKGLATAGSNVAYLTASGVSGMVAGQIPIAASATTITSSGNLSGAVTTSGSLATTLSANAVATTNIANANVTYAKIQNVTAARLLGNPTGSAAAPSEISLGTNLAFAGTVLNGLATPVTVANGGTNKTSWTAGSVAFAGAGGTALQEDNANLFWDDTNNRLCVGGASPATRMHVFGASGVGNNAMIVSCGPAGADTTTTMLQFADFGYTTVNGSITRNGTNTVIYATTSDARLKENLVDSEIGLEALKALRVRDYTFIGDDRRQQGLVAQELAKIYPQAVHEGGDDPAMQPWMIDYGRLTPLLIRTAQQQEAKIEALERRLTALEGSLATRYGS